MAPDHDAERLADPGAERRAAERDERQPAGVLGAEHRRADAAADVGPADEADERQRPDDEAAPQAGERQQDHEPERDQVEESHP